MAASDEPLELSRVLGRLRPGRRIEGMSAVLLPFGLDGRPDLDAFTSLLERTYAAGLTPAVNMDTGYVNLLTAGERAEVLGLGGRIAAGRRFVAGAFIEGRSGPPAAAYLAEVEAIVRAGGTPIVFQSSALTRLADTEILEVYRELGRAAPTLLAFELGQMFAPFGRIYPLDLVCRLMEIPSLRGIKHSSLDRVLEWQRLEARDRVRPDFHVYTGNDLAIDMVFYGSDYLLGLSAFSVEGFAARDRLWREDNPEAIALNDLLQYLGAFAFRPPVPAYKHSAAQFLHLRGLIPSDAPHPAAPRRPAADEAVLRAISEQLDARLARLQPATAAS